MICYTFSSLFLRRLAWSWTGRTRNRNAALGHACFSALRFAAGQILSPEQDSDRPLVKAGTHIRVRSAQPCPRPSHPSPGSRPIPGSGGPRQVIGTVANQAGKEVDNRLPVEFPSRSVARRRVVAARQRAGLSEPARTKTGPKARRCDHETANRNSETDGVGMLVLELAFDINSYFVLVSARTAFKFKFERPPGRRPPRDASRALSYASARACQ